MIIKESIILAGGLGTRLREAVPDLPKCMAPVAGRPFLFYVINYLRSQGIEKFIFSLGYKHEIIETYLKQHFSTLSYECVVEQAPLGTGGAIKLALEKTTGENVLVTNGDTLFKCNIPSLSSVHETRRADCTLALKPMCEFDRYGVVELDEDDSIKSFKEKKYYSSGNINGGVYLLNKESFIKHPWPAKFSFEKDYLQQTTDRLCGVVQEGYFIDIGIPGDYTRAQDELKRSPLELGDIGKSWSLFLDRDGVINVDKEGSYIFSHAEFVFTKGAPALFRKLGEKFGPILVVTNQRGVGRQLMTEQALMTIHQEMIMEVQKAGGRIDAIYYCTSIHNDHPQRKPNPGMAYLAKEDFPSIDMSRAVMVGNNPSDMQFGRNAGMYTVFIKSTRPGQELPHPDIDLAFDSLQDFVNAL